MNTRLANAEEWKTGQEKNLALIRKHGQKTDRPHKGQETTIKKYAR
jgi:hypothetical protein